MHSGVVGWKLLYTSVKSIWPGVLLKSAVSFFSSFFLFFSVFSFFHLFLAALGLHCCVWAFSSCSKQGLLFVAVHRLLIAVSSLVVEHRL